MSSRARSSPTARASGRCCSRRRRASNPRLAGRGNGLVASRLGAALNPAAWANEASGGIDYLFFLRDLINRVDSDWSSVEAALIQIRDTLIDRDSMVVNVTADGAVWDGFRPNLEAFIASLPTALGAPLDWPTASPQSEGLTFPAQVNYVAKGANLYPLGYVHTGASDVALRHLNTTYMWDRVRVQGGAYGGSASFDPFSGAFVFTSYRDPNLLQTLDAYDGAAAYLKRGRRRAGPRALDHRRHRQYRHLPVARRQGLPSLMWELTGNTDANRQQRRDEVLGATAKDFKRFGEVIAAVRSRARRRARLGRGDQAANDERGGFLRVTKVL